MRSIIVSCLLASLTACAPNVIGTWFGTTSECADASDDGTDVTISVTSDKAAVVTTLGLATAGAVACTSESGDVDDPTALTFSTNVACGADNSVDYDVALVANADSPDSQSGTIDVSVNDGEASRCQLTVTR